MRRGGGGREEGGGKEEGGEEKKEEGEGNLTGLEVHIIHHFGCVHWSVVLVDVPRGEQIAQ